jgi:hypothetical protein
MATVIEFEERTALPLDEQRVLFKQALAQQNTEQLYQCTEWLGVLKWQHKVEWELCKIQIKTAFGKNLSIRDFQNVVTAEAQRQEKAAAGEKPDVAHVAIQWALAHRESWAYDIDDHCWYQWTGSHWQPLQEESGKPSPLDQDAITALTDAGIAVNSNQTLNCFRRVAASYSKRDLHTDQPNFINFANGTLDITTQQLHAHNRDDNFAYCLGYNFDPSGSHPHIDAFLATTIDDEHARQALIAHIGLALIRDTSFHNFCLLIGPPRAGKSTVLALKNAVCGMIADPYRFAGPSLFGRDLEGKRARAQWVELRGVCVDELPGEALRDEECLKIMSAHGGVEMRKIGKDEKTDNRWYPKLLMSTNDTPHYKDVSGAIRERALIIECPHGPRPDNQQDKELWKRDLAPEIGAFAATCLRYALALKANGYYPRSAQMRRHLDEIEHFGNPLKSFIRECCVLEPGAKLTVDALYKEYCEYTEGSGNSPMAKNKMSSSIRDMRIGVTVGEWMRWNGRPTRALKGIRLRNDFDGDPVDPAYPDDPLLFTPAPGSPPPINSGPPVPDHQEPAPAPPAETPPAVRYPETMSKRMEPAPADPCPTCGENAWAPYWSNYVDRKWGCAHCHPRIIQEEGCYDPAHPDLYRRTE